MRTIYKVVIGALVPIAGLAVLMQSYGGIRNKIIRLASATVPYSRDHEINKMVTQGRAFTKKYSGCGDLWNYVLDEIGAPDSWVNRDSPKRINPKTGKSAKWGVAVNISKPWGAATRDGARVNWKRGTYPKPGDLMLIGDENRGELAHVMVILAREKDKNGEAVFTTAEYGGANNAGNLSHRSIAEDGLTGAPGWRRHVVGWIDADKIPIEKRG